MGVGREHRDRWQGRLTHVCPPSSVKVDKDRQMVVLEEEFQVRGWGMGLGGPKGCD